MTVVQQLVPPSKVKLTDGKEFTIEPNTPMKRVRSKAFLCASCGRRNNLDPYKVADNGAIVCSFCGATVGIAEW